MTRYAVFLRGVNVGGRTIAMVDLRRVLGELPVTDVKTLLASGNVVCRFAGDAPTLRSLVETALRKAFGYEAWVVVLSAERLEQLVGACPYPADSAEEHTYVTVASDPVVLDEVAAAVAEAGPDVRQTRLGPEATAWVAAVGASLDAPWSAVANKARYKKALTDRNLRTMHKVLSALRAMGP